MDCSLTDEDGNPLIFDVVLEIPGTGTVYHEDLPPMDCGFKIQMTIRFCKNVSQNEDIKNNVVIFEDFKFLEVLSPYSELCWQWIAAFMNLSDEEQAEVFKKIKDDFEYAFEKKFMELWVSHPNNQFDPCPEKNPCHYNLHAVYTKYYKASCTKVCYWFDPDCHPVLCMKEHPCYKDGCCKVERTYCLDSQTQEVKQCHEAYYGDDCTVPVEDVPNCFFVAKECDPNIPDCLPQ